MDILLTFLIGMVLQEWGDVPNAQVIVDGVKNSGEIILLVE